MYKQHCNIGIVGRGFVGSAVGGYLIAERKFKEDTLNNKNQN